VAVISQNDTFLKTKLSNHEKTPHELKINLRTRPQAPQLKPKFKKPKIIVHTKLKSQKILHQKSVKPNPQSSQRAPQRTPKPKPKPSLQLFPGEKNSTKNRCEKAILNNSF